MSSRGADSAPREAPPAPSAAGSPAPVGDDGAREDGLLEIGARARERAGDVGLDRRERRGFALATLEAARVLAAGGGAPRASFEIRAGGDGSRELVATISRGTTGDDASPDGGPAGAREVGAALARIRRLAHRTATATGPSGPSVIVAMTLPARAVAPAPGRRDGGAAPWPLVDDLLDAACELAESEEARARLDGELAETNLGVVALHAELEAAAAELRELAAEQAALRRVATAVAGDLGSGSAFAAIAREAAALLGAGGALLVRFGDEGRVSAAGHWTADGQGPVDGTDLDGLGGLPARVGAATGPIRWDPPRAGALAGLGAVGATGAVAAPVGGHPPWGALVVLAGGDGLGPAAHERLAAVAALATIAVARSEAHERLVRQAMTDSLTGLANSRAFHERLASEVRRAARYGRPLSLVLFDLDRFKRVNDSHGHQAGDRVLQGMASVLGAHAREGDLVARIGGEEMAWILPETTGEDAYRAADRARALMEATDIEGVGTVTVSGGVSALPDGVTPGEFFRLADEALYRAKAAGRNRVARWASTVTTS